MDTGLEVVISDENKHTAYLNNWAEELMELSSPDSSEAVLGTSQFLPRGKAS